MENAINNLADTIEKQIIEVKKELLKSKVNAKFSHYSGGKLYYNIKLECGSFQFPINVFENVKEKLYVVNEGEIVKTDLDLKLLSSDLGTTNFDDEIKGSFLNRWIDKAIRKEDFVKIG